MTSKDEVKNAEQNWPNEKRPAFPTNARMADIAQGMTKREYFAIHILSAIVTHELPVPGVIDTGINAVKYSVELADKLLNELLKK